MWKLTDEEIMAVHSPERGEGLLEALYESADAMGKAGLLNYQRDLIQAQAKKLVEWGDEDCKEHCHSLFSRFECADCLEELRRQVGLE